MGTLTSTNDRILLSISLSIHISSSLSSPSVYISSSFILTSASIALSALTSIRHTHHHSTSWRKMVKHRFGIIMLLRSMGLFACPCLLHDSKESDNESIDVHQPESIQLARSHPININKPFPSPPILHHQTASTAYHQARIGSSRASSRSSPSSIKNKTQQLTPASTYNSRRATQHHRHHPTTPTAAHINLHTDTGIDPARSQ